MKARHALGGLALMLGTALPAAAEPPDGVQRAQAQPGPGARRQSVHGSEGRGPMQGHHGWHRRAKAHDVSVARLALRHRQELALTPAQVDNLRKLGTDAQRDAIKRQADRRLAELDLRTLMMPDTADPAKAMDMAKVEAKVREIEKLRADERVARISSLEQSRQVLTPEQREKLRALLAQRGQPRGPHGPGMRGMAPADHGQAGAEDGSQSG
jgi:Spy/CpxP family protein refolding chaperone